MEHLPSSPRSSLNDPRISGRPFSLWDQPYDHDEPLADPELILARQRSRIHDLLGDILPFANEDIAAADGYLPLRQNQPRRHPRGPAPSFPFSRFTITRTWTRRRVKQWMERVEWRDGVSIRAVERVQESEERISTDVFMAPDGLRVIHRMRHTQHSRISRLLLLQQPQPVRRALSDPTIPAVRVMGVTPARTVTALPAGPALALPPHVPDPASAQP